MFLRTILITALLAGVMTGVLFTAIQQFQVTPLIIEAEAYESPSNDHSHATKNEHAHESDVTDHGSDSRLLLSLLANILAGIGFALVVISCIVFTDHKGWRKGILWGTAGFLVFFVAPSLGLSPKLPGGSGAPPLLHQQLWWVSTAAATAAGLAMLVFSRTTLLRGIGLLLLFIPHLIGAPQSEQLVASAPQNLLQQFIISTTIVNALFWLFLGAVSGFLLRHLNDSTSASQ